MFPLEHGCPHIILLLLWACRLIRRHHLSWSYGRKDRFPSARTIRPSVMLPPRFASAYTPYSARAKGTIDFPIPSRISF